MTIEQNNVLKHANYNDDEISLYDLYRVLVKRKKLIAIIIASVLAISIVYLFLATKIYQVTAILLPPVDSDLYLTNIDISADTNFKPDQVFKQYTQEIISNENWYNFTKYERSLLHDLKDGARLRNPMILEKDKKYLGEHFLVIYDTADQGMSAQILQHYLNYTEKGYIAMLTEQINHYIRYKIKALDQEIQFERESAKQGRMDKIVQLKSDLAIADKLGIKENLFFNLAGKAPQNKAGVFNVFTGNTSLPTYLRGSKVINAELDALKNRESDDPFIPSLRQKQDQLLRLQKVLFTPDSFHAYRLDGQIDNPTHAIKPRKLLVLVLGAVLGLFLGILSAFVAEFLANAHEQNVA